jgi:hypothetical protein
LLRRLIHATVSNIDHIGFPADEGVQLGGWDGIVIVQSGNAFVPNGSSVWELGITSSVKGKADEDYEKRCEAPLGQDPANTTFIFVTPRRWGGKDAWVRKRQKEGFWRDVKAYDADDLQQWLDLAPAVHIWLSTLMGKHPEAAEDITSFWEDWSEATNPALSTDLLTLGRETIMDRVCEWLRETPSTLSLKADTTQEAVAFFAATLHQFPPELRLPLLSKTVIVRDLGTWNHLCASQSALILVPIFDVGNALTRAFRHGHHIFVPLGRDGSDSEATLELPRVGVIHAREALLGMGLPEVRASELASLAHRSLMALRRKIALSPEVQQPVWAKPESARALIPALLAGAWKDTQEGDRTIIARLANSSYDDVSTALCRWANEADPPVRRTGDAWLLVSKEDAWSLLSRYLTRDDLVRFEAVISDVLGELDPALELPEEQRIMAGLLGKTLTHSGLLRNGLAETLALMGARSETTRWADSRSPQERANYIVGQLLERANNDWRIWTSIAYLLPRLAESAPREYLRQVENGLRGNEPVLAKLFEDSTYNISARSSHTGLLWSLEVLAWHPDYLSRAALCLAILARIDPGGRLGNRPNYSLRNIFLVWHPCTTVSLDHRLEVIDLLTDREPSVAWRLLNQLLPELHSHTELTSKARWREWVPEEQPSVTYDELWTAERQIVERMLREVGYSGERWNDLIEHLDDVQAEQHQAIVAQLLAVNTATLLPEDRLIIWSALRTLIYRHRSYPEAGWAMPSALVDHLVQLYHHFEPNNMVDRYSWIFSLTPKLIEHFGEDWLARHKAINEAREEAVKALYKQGGLPMLLEFSNHVEQPYELGMMLGKNDLITTEEDSLLSRNLGLDYVPSNIMAWGFVAGRYVAQGREWVENKKANIVELVPSPEQQAVFFISLPFEGRTWDLLETMSPEVQGLYWSHIRPGIIAVTDWDRAVTNLLGHGRPHIALDLTSLYLNNAEAQLSVKLIADALDLAIRTSPDRKEDWQILYDHAGAFLDRLESSGEIEPALISSLELALLPFLEHGERGPKVLHGQLSANPMVFLDALTLAYKAEGQDEQDLTEMDIAHARLAQSLLESWRRLPGTLDDGSIDAEALQEWVLLVRESARVNGRGKIADNVIGQVLSFAPQDSDGSWPTRPVRDIIEKVGSEELHWGFVIGVRNRRGVVQKTLTEGGAQEWRLVERYRRYADMVRGKWPRTATALDEIADRYSSEARRSDLSVELEQDLLR